MTIRPVFPVLGGLAGFLLARRRGGSPLAAVLIGAGLGWLLAALVARVLLRGLNAEMRNINAAQAALIAEKICSLERELQAATPNTARAVELVDAINRWKQALALANYHYENCQATKLTTP